MLQSSLPGQEVAHGECAATCCKLESLRQGLHEAWLQLRREMGNGADGATTFFFSLKARCAKAKVFRLDHMVRTHDQSYRIGPWAIGNYSFGGARAT